MLIRLFSVFIVCIFVAGANAQLVQDTRKHSFERVYLLIDSSGSMEDVHSILQEEVSDQLAQARSLYPTAQIYTSFFGADTAAECFAAPTLARMDDTSGALVVPRDGYKQSTPLGEALKAAITDAHGHSAKIILFSDEQQTPQCGIDICTVAASYLPIEGLKLESIAIGADAQDRDRLGCLFGAQFSGAAGGDAETSGQTTSRTAETNTRKQQGWDEYRLIEQLPFIIGLALILSSAFFFQIYYGDRAVHVEKQIGELSENLPNPYPEDDIEPKKLEDESKPLLQRADVWLAGVGLFVLLAVVFWPRNAPYFADYFIRARSVSWLVVNSTFFTGVAILGIAPLLLAGAQYWRHAQARQKFYVVSGNYTLEKRRRLAEQLAFAIDTVGRLKREVREIEFQSPPEPKKRRLSRSLSVFGQPSGTRATEPKPVDRDKWDHVCEVARQLALAVTTPEEFDPLADEVERLEKYLKLRGGKSKKLADFVSLLVVDDKVKLEAEHWKELSNAISSQSVSRINGAMAQLASN